MLCTNCKPVNVFTKGAKRKVVQGKSQAGKCMLVTWTTTTAAPCLPCLSSLPLQPHLPYPVRTSCLPCLHSLPRMSLPCLLLLSVSISFTPCHCSLGLCLSNHPFHTSFDLLCLCLHCPALCLTFMLLLDKYLPFLLLFASCPPSQPNVLFPRFVL